LVGASILVVGLAAAVLVRWPEARRVERYALKDVLWVEDVAGRRHPPGSELSREMLALLARSGSDLSEKPYTTYVLIRQAALQGSDRSETPLIVMGGSPATRK